MHMGTADAMVGSCTGLLYVSWWNVLNFSYDFEQLLADDPDKEHFSKFAARFCSWLGAIPLVLVLVCLPWIGVPV